MNTRPVLLFCVLLIAATANDAFAQWPGFLGPNRDGLSPDTGLLKTWPENGPPLLWQVDDLGAGWSSIAVVDGCIYTTGNADGKQMLICLGLDGRDRWRVAQGPMCSHRNYSGARSTPTIDGDRIYVTGGNGLVTCHRKDNGQIIWQRDMAKEMGGRVGGWLYAESVLVLDDLAIVTPGGENAVVALDKQTGADVWKSDATAKAGYSSCIAVGDGDDRIIINGTQSGLLVLDAGTGAKIELIEFAVDNTANVPTPVFVDDHLFWAVGYGKGAICFDVERKDGSWSFQEAWRSRDLNCHPGNYVVANGRVYGKGRGGLSCVDLKSGETLWQERIGAGQATWADGMVYSFSDSDGRISLVDPEAGETKLVASFEVEGEGRSWAHPVIIDGRLYLRYDTNLYCYNVRAD